MKLEEMKITELFDTSHTIAARLFEGKTYPWEVLADLGSFIEQLGATLPEKEYRKIGKKIWVHRTGHHLRRSRHPSGGVPARSHHRGRALRCGQFLRVKERDSL